MDVPTCPKGSDASGFAYHNDVPMGAVPIPPDCASRAFPHLVAAGTVGSYENDCGAEASAAACLAVDESDPCKDEGPIEWGHWPEEGDDGVPKGVRNKQLGAKGEEAACRFLHRHGYLILERNWTCPAGEADIICLGDDTLVFVEVKTRRGDSKGFPSEAVTRKKRERYERIALCYLKESDLVDVNVRFDVVSVVAMERSRAFIRHSIGAFQCL